MLAYRDGDAPAFERLFARHRRALFTYLLHDSGSRALAEDLFQEVFLRVIRGRERYQPDGSFRAWLFTIARNASTDQRRREALRETESVNGTMNDESELRTPPAREPATRGNATDPLALSQARELRARGEAALLRLPREQREVFLLRERAGLDFRSIAEATGCELATAKSRMRYALAGLRRILSSELGSLLESSHD